MPKKNVKLYKMLKEPCMVWRRLKIRHRQQGWVLKKEGRYDSRLAPAALCCARHEVCLTAYCMHSMDATRRTQAKLSYNLAEHPEIQGSPWKHKTRLCWREARYLVHLVGLKGYLNNWILRNGRQTSLTSKATWTAQKTKASKKDLAWKKINK